MNLIRTINTLPTYAAKSKKRNKNTNLQD